MGSLFQDIRFGIRMLLKSPGFTVVAVVTLALGIGANTAMFSLVEGVILAPLNYFKPDRLVMVWENNPRFPRVWNSYPNFKDWLRSAHSFQSMSAFREQGVDLTHPGPPSHVNTNQISADFFSTLGVQLELGREFTLQENQPGGAAEVVISYGLWKERFGGSPEVLGRAVTLDGVNHSIVGVAPPGFRLDGDADVYTPVGQIDPLVLNNRATHDGIFTVARLKPGVTISQSQAEMSTIQNSLDRLYPNDNRDLGIYVEPLKQAIIGDAGQTLKLLLGAVGLLLLIACANLANLLLARSAARNREFAIRSALGATRIRVLRQLLTESVLLSFAGAALGMLLALVGIRFVLPLISGLLPRANDIRVNVPVLLYAVAISLAVGILSGIVPGLKSSDADRQSSPRDGGRGSTTAQRRAQNSFVVVQVALTAVLLVGAGLLFRTILQLWKVNPGFDTKNIVTFKVGVSHSLTKTASSTRIAYQQLIDGIRQVPGVQTADFSTAVPLTGQGGYLPFWLDSREPESAQGAPRLQPFLVGPDYLRAMGMQLLEGRFLTQHDTTNSPCVAVIDGNFAHKFFPDENPTEHTVTAGFGSAAFGPCAIVGVVNHVKDAGLDEVGVANQYQTYYSLYQDPDRWVPVNYPDASVIVRTRLDAAALVPAVRAAVSQLGGDQALYQVQTMKQIVSDSMSAQRLPMFLLAAFASLALLLAAVGIYGVVSCSVTQRVQEIGIRMALGADKNMVLSLFLGRELKLVLTGLALGAVGSFILTRTLSSLNSLLYGVKPYDPLTFAAVSILLVSVAALSCYIPARRAAKVDPMVALRYE